MKLSKFENNYLNKLKPYKLASHEIWNNENNENNVIKVDWNESTRKTDEAIISAIIKKIEHPGLNYYPNLNNSKLKSLISEYTNINVNSLAMTPSSDNAHELIINAFMHPADVALIIGPTYDNFRVVCESKGINVKNINYYDGDLILKNIVDKVQPRLVYICNPNNPTGDMIDVKEIENLIKTYNDKIFLIDEAYFEFSKKTCAELVVKYKNIIVTRTLSKAFSLAGIRFGYILAHVSIINSLNKIINHKNLPTLTQIAAEAAFENISIMQNYVKEVNIQKEIFCDNLNNLFDGVIKYRASGGNYILIEFQNDDMKKKFLNKASSYNIFIRDIGHIGLDFSIRITIGDEKSMSKINEMMLSWKNDYL